MYPLERRIKALDLLLHLEKPTTKAVPYCEWETPPKLNVEVESPFFIFITGNLNASTTDKQIDWNTFMMGTTFKIFK